MFKYKPQLLFHHTARFPWHPLFLNLSLPSLQCQECPRSNLSGMCPVCTPVRDLHPPRSSQDLKDLQPRSQAMLASHLPPWPTRFSPLCPFVSVACPERSRMGG